MAKKINPFQENTLPPFVGFPTDALTFLKQLGKNNTREWFADNKVRYEQSIKEPMESLLSSLSEKLRGFDPDIVIEPKKAMYRIYRDVRFSRDKSPYKNWAAAAFTFKGFDRKTDPAFYFHFNTKELGIGGGMYAPSSEQLNHVRKAISKDVKSFRGILTDKKFLTWFPGLEGEVLSRVPQGYEKDHPEAELLRHKQFLCWTTSNPAVITEQEFFTTLTNACKAMAPFIKWLATNSR